MPSVLSAQGVSPRFLALLASEPLDRSRVLDVGCGSGRLTLALAAAAKRVVGLDRDAAAMLMIESDLPGTAADDELAPAETVCVQVGATTTVRSQTPAEADMLRQARRAAHWAPGVA